MFLRDQDWTLDQQYELTKHWGVPDRDPIQLDPRHVTIIGRDNDRRYANFGSDFHNDHSFEANPPAYTTLRMDKTPPSGGDTIFTSQVALFDKLSTTYQKLLEGLHGVHSSEASYINVINGGGKAFRPPTRQEHPLVRTHPVTKLNSLYYNPSIMIHIKELKEQEGIHVLAFLREHMHAADQCLRPGISPVLNHDWIDHAPPEAGTETHWFSVQCLYAIVISSAAEMLYNQRALRQFLIEREQKVKTAFGLLEGWRKHLPTSLQEIHKQNTHLILDDHHVRDVTLSIFRQYHEAVFMIYFPWADNRSDGRVSEDCRQGMISRLSKSRTWPSPFLAPVNHL